MKCGFYGSLWRNWGRDEQLRRRIAILEQRIAELELAQERPQSFVKLNKEA